jgi:multidrug efflux system outer membrane protein
VLQAEQTLFPAELALAEQRASLFASAATIYEAMGGGWVVVADRTTGSSSTPPVAQRGRGRP